MIEKIRAFIVKNYLWVNLALLIPLAIMLVIGIISKSLDITIIIIGLIFYFAVPLLMKLLKLNGKYNNVIVVLLMLMLVYTIVYTVLGIASLKLYSGPVGALIFMLMFVRILKQNTN